MAIDRLGFYDTDQVKQFLTPGGNADLSGSFQTTNAILNGLSALDGTSGILVQTGASTFTKRTLTAPAAGITVSNGTGAGGNPTLALANDLAALEALSGTNTIYYRSGVDTWTAVTIGSGLSFSGGTLSNSSTVTGAALTKTDDTNVTITLGGTPATALLQAASLTLGWTGQLAVGRGGTAIGSYAVGDILYASAATTLSKLAAVATGNVLISGGVTTAPSWGKVGISTHVSGLGTGVATALAVNVGSTGAFVTFNGALGTPSSGTLTNCTFASPPATALTLLNSVTNVGGSYATAAYRKYADNRVAVEGWLQGAGGTSPLQIATLPAGARPLANQTFPCVNFAGGAPFAGMFEVQATGGVFWYTSNTSAAFSISGINFQT